MRGLTLSLGLCLAATAGHAACPGAEAMAGAGVWIETDDGGVLHFERRGDLVIETSIYAPDDMIETQTHKGLYFLQDGTLKDGNLDRSTMTRYEYPEFDSLPDPNAQGTWNGAVKVFSDGGDQSVQHQLTVSIGAESEMAIGDCTYPGRIVAANLRQALGGGWATQYFYLSDLGFAFFVAAGETPLAYEYSYRAVSISSDPP
ncbi:MAG: hypothetical protein AAGI13_06805 [Pseudomonadota bacterium]